MLRSLRVLSRAAGAPRRAVRAMSSVTDVARFPRHRFETLANGVRVVSEPSSDNAVSVGVYLDTGSRHELDVSVAGVANLSARVKAAAQRAGVESIGASLATSTSREATSFRARVAAKDAIAAVGVLGDVVRGEVKGELLEAERAAVLSEMARVDERAEDVVFDRLHETAFRGTPLARSPLGAVATVKSLGSKDIDSFVNTHYTGNRIVVAASGPVDHNQLVEAANKAFGALPEKNAAAVVVPALYTGSEIRIRHDYEPRAHGAIAFAAPGHGDVDQVALSVAQELMGTWSKGQWRGTNSNRPLVQEVSRYNLADSIKTFNINYSDVGLFGLYFVCDWQGQHELVGHIMSSFCHLSHDVPQEPFASAQQAAILKALSRYDNGDKNADELGRQVLSYGRRVHPEEWVKRISAVTPADIKRVASAYLWDHDHAFAALGPIYEMPDYNYIRQRTYMRRF